MEQDNGRSLRDGLSPTVEPASSLDGSATSIPSADDRVCVICDGGPGNENACLCGHKKWESTVLPSELVREALEAVNNAAQYDACMDGAVFKGWNRSALDRALPKVIAALEAINSRDNDGSPEGRDA